LLKIKQHIQSEQQCFDNFLSRIVEQLTKLGQAITAAMEQAKVDKFAIQTVRLNVNKITELKAIINKRLAILFEEFQARIQKEVIQRQKTQQQLDELTQKVKDMASESSSLKLQLKTAKSKALTHI
jgi:diguanylate cyclase